jgi:mannose-1-phosphate guanylyltransferase
MPINGQPLLDIWLESLTKSGIGPFLINTHYLSDQVVKYVRESKYANAITLIYEPILKGTAGTLIQNLSFFNEEDGLLIHADNYCLEDINLLINAHNLRPSHCLMTMLTFRTDTPSSCGIVELDKEGVVTNFIEKSQNPPGNMANGAIYILSSKLISILGTSYREVKDFSTEVIGDLHGKIYTFETKKLFLDIGTIEAYKKINKI